MAKKISSPTHDLVKHFVKLRKEKKYREEMNTLIIFGHKILNAITNKIKIKTFITYDENLLNKHPNSILCTYEIMKKIANVPSPESVAAEIFLPAKLELKNENYLLVLDKINDPGNLGTLIRSAHALNFDGVIITPQSVDPFNEKAIRAAKGSTLFIPLFFYSSDEISKIASEKGVNLYLADLNGQDVKDVRFSKPLMLVLSSESHGIDKWTKEITNKVRIPMREDIDSLNVATSGSILLYLIRRSI